MKLQIERAAYDAVKAMRDLYRQEANCQIIHDSFLVRQLADPYLILVDGHPAGYGAVGNTYPPNCVTEFYTLPSARRFALPMFRELITVSGATKIEAQSNIPLMLLMLYDCATNIQTASILFEDAFTSQLSLPDVNFRQSILEDAPYFEEVGEWVLTTNGTVIATGGFLTHYNPPYGDIYMEVVESERRKGFGSFLVQELKRVCYEAGRKPAARCNPHNLASRGTLQKAGLLPCGRLLVGDVLPT